MMSPLRRKIIWKISSQLSKKIIWKISKNIKSKRNWMEGWLCHLARLLNIWDFLYCPVYP